MTQHEKLTMIIAILALLLSSVNTYFQLFYSSDRLRASITMFRPAEDRVVYDVVFINSGTRYQSVSAVTGWTSDRPFDENGSRHGVPVSSDPIVITPGQMIHMRFEHEFLPDPLRQEMYSALQFDTVDAQGELHQILAPLLHFTPNDIGWSYNYNLIGGVFDLSLRSNGVNPRVVRPLAPRTDSQTFGVGRPVGSVPQSSGDARQPAQVE